MENKNIKGEIKDRASALRLRTLTVTLVLVVALIFYFLVVLVKKEVDWVEFVILCSVQIITYLTYFPDGELFGQRNIDFINNKASYNSKANKINEDCKISALREYCDYEYEERKERYIQKECGAIGITKTELEELKGKPAKEIKKLTEYEFKTPNGSKLIFFTREKRKRLYGLIFKEIPVEKNNVSTIMSAVENDEAKSIRDGSITYKAKAYVRKFFMAIVVGGIFAYIGWKTKDGVGFAEIVSIFMCIAALVVTAVMSFNNGETNTKVYKNQFYLKLANYIDGFNEWYSKKQK